MFVFGGGLAEAEKEAKQPTTSQPAGDSVQASWFANASSRFPFAVCYGLGQGISEFEGLVLAGLF